LGANENETSFDFTDFWLKRLDSSLYVDIQLVESIKFAIEAIKEREAAKVKILTTTEVEENQTMGVAITSPTDIQENNNENVQVQNEIVQESSTLANNIPNAEIITENSNNVISTDTDNVILTDTGNVLSSGSVEDGKAENTDITKESAATEVAPVNSGENVETNDLNDISSQEIQATQSDSVKPAEPVLEKAIDVPPPSDNDDSEMALLKRVEKLKLKIDDVSLDEVNAITEKVVSFTTFFMDLNFFLFK
jgi:hypothetical protein